MDRQIVDRRSMPPPPAPPRVTKKKLVELDEDTYTANLEAIIERDFFPDVPKMRSTLEWLDAVKSGDPTRIRQAQINIAHRRAGMRTPSTPQFSRRGGLTAGATPALGRTPMGRPGTESWATPGTNLMGTPTMTPVHEDGGMTPATFGGEPIPGPSVVAGVEAEPRAPSMGLDKFLSNYTSEDNASFHRIVEEHEIKKRARYSHHLDDKNAQQALSHQDKAHATDGYGSGGQKPMTLTMCKHEPMSNIYYNPSSVKQEPDEVAMAVASVAADSAARSGCSASVSAAASNAYDRLATPAFTPGEGGESPFMTWGDIGSTPLRLDGEDIYASGHSVLHQIAHKSSLLKGKGMAGSGALMRSPSPALATLQQQTRTPNVPMSPAARALAKKLGKNGGGGLGQEAAGAKLAGRDLSLRASYGSGSRSRGGTPGGGTGGRPFTSTPGMGTPGCRDRRGSGTPQIVQVGGGEAQLSKPSGPAAAAKTTLGMSSGDITDNLLNL
eukprot:gene16799-23077_t